MHISLNWLKEFVDWKGSVSALDELLTSTGLSVENTITRGVDIPHVVVAQILESTQHPNADRLSVCRVDDGSGHPRQIVCGAKNYKVGDKVPLALPGAVLPGDFKIKVGKLRGVESEGMMCSAKELGLAEDAQGLHILPEDAVVGRSLSELFPPETILELEITPNRGDWLSHVGVAREVAAFARLPLNYTPPALSATQEGEVSIQDTTLCPFYSVRRIRNVKVGPSPAWLKQRLESVGLRAINNVVDITNYVMLEMGQPLHAFDAAKVNGAIQVRTAQSEETFLALDGREYTLTPENLVIADQSQAIAIAGVMGGELSGVTETTTEILLESAIFQTSSVRRTGRQLELHSDSSYRFERGVDPAGVLLASARATQLIVEIAGGEADEVTFTAGSVPTENKTVSLRRQKAVSLLGAELSNSEIIAALQALGLKLVEQSDDTTSWQVPSHRLDLTREVDLIEELARLVGIEKIAGRLQAGPAEPGEADAAYDFQMEIRRRLQGFGLSEARTSTLVSESAIVDVPTARRLRNPLGEDQAFLRTNLVTGLLSAVERNVRHGAKTIGLYEIGRTFHAEGTEERVKLTLVLTGENAVGTWRGDKSRPFDWYDAKGLVESLITGQPTWKKVEAVEPLALRADLAVGTVGLGYLGQVSPSRARELDVTTPILVAEIDLGALRGVRTGREFQEIPRFPAVTRDLAIVCPLTLSYEEIVTVLRGVQEPLLTSIEPFDVFTDPRGEKLPADRKSVAISLTFRASERTLNSEEVNTACDRLRNELKTKLAVDFRE